MDLRQLRSLVVLGEEEHFTRAAERLRIAQPALSQQIRKLEDEVGVPLVDRTTRRVALTDAGQGLVDRARRALAEVEAAEAELRDLRGLRTGRVVIGLTLTPGPLDLPQLLAVYNAENPEVDLAVREDLSRPLAASLRADVVDLAFLTRLETADYAGLETRPLTHEAMVAVLPPDHPLARRGEPIDMGELRDEPFVAFRAGATTRATVERVAQGYGFVPRFAFESGEVARIRGIVSAGLAVSVLPRSDASRPGPAVAVVPFREPGELVHELVLGWRAGRRHAPAVRAFIDHALATFA